MPTDSNSGRLSALQLPAGDRLLVVDGHAYAYRAFHAIRQLNSPDGAPTNAIYGFIKMLGKLRLLTAPSHLLVIWDGGLSAERTKAHASYKAQRPPMPEGLAQQFDEIIEYLRAAGIASWCQDGAEADDRIAAVARQAVAGGASVIIASSDKDFMQLVNSRIGLINPNDRIERIWTDAEVVAKAGVRPDQIVDWLSLIGDSVDNIPGVRGIGPKTATELLVQFGTIEVLFQRLEEVSSDRLRASLAGARDDLRRNQELIRLREEVGGDFALADARLGDEDQVKLTELFRRWGFRSMQSELAARQESMQGQLL